MAEPTLDPTGAHAPGTVEETMPPGLDGERIDRVVALVTGCSRAEAADLVATGQVLVGADPVTTRSVRVAEGDRVTISWTPPPPPSIDPDPSVEVDVVHVDDDVIVVDKRAGQVVHPGSGQDHGTLVHGLVARFPELVGVGADPVRPGVVHRLDKETSGLLMVARTPRAHESLSAQLRSRSAQRRYRALVFGHLDTNRGVVDAPIGRSGRTPTKMAVTTKGREARTGYEVHTRYRDPVPLTLLRCELETGRTHQIRVHLSAIGHPVVGDVRYGGAKAPFDGLSRFFLHAEELSFLHPGTGELLAFTSELPTDLVAVLDGLVEVPPPTPGDG